MNPNEMRKSLRMHYLISKINTKDNKSFLYKKKYIIQLQEGSFDKMEKKSVKDYRYIRKYDVCYTRRKKVTY